MAKRRVILVVEGKRYEPVTLAPYLRDSKSIVVSEPFKPKENESLFDIQRRSSDQDKNSGM